MKKAKRNFVIKQLNYYLHCRHLLSSTLAQER